MSAGLLATKSKLSQVTNKGDTKGWKNLNNYKASFLSQCLNCLIAFFICKSVFQSRKSPLGEKKGSEEKEEEEECQHAIETDARAWSERFVT